MSYWRVRNRKFSEYGKGKTCRKMAEKSPKPMRDINVTFRKDNKHAVMGIIKNCKTSKIHFKNKQREKSGAMKGRKIRLIENI